MFTKEQILEVAAAHHTMQSSDMVWLAELCKSDFFLGRARIALIEMASSPQPLQMLALDLGTAMNLGYMIAKREMEKKSK